MTDANYVKHMKVIGKLAYYSESKLLNETLKLGALVNCFDHARS